MSKWIVLMKKEFVQMIRDFRIVWLPIAFMFLGATQPVVNYYLPSILKSLGGSQGITIDPNMAQLEGGEVLASTLASQFDQLGIMILVIAIMGIIQTDKSNGMLSFILTRPVAVPSYIASKVVSNYILLAFSVSVGYFTSYIYVNYLFTSVPLSQVFVGLIFYLVWLLFIVSFTTMVSTIFKSQGVIALISIGTLLGCRLVIGLSPIVDQVNPAVMSKYAIEYLSNGAIHSNIFSSSLFTFAWLLVILITIYYWIFNKKFTTE
ncbi:ABC transporter permease [Solibacillus sp. MA9]|uniref:ABC transporter permease n=1 Tax=Solibacillus palustris TaxID=2908203 RepID=A0ABS9UAZ8_9BACL|nr:ABC transporter permease subunit [Solibacillus sp. MA9]MCH7321507.1 ABC transporter permease [Solibacillus sp. MA9]